MTHRTISLIALGGTISAQLQPEGGAQPGLTAAELQSYAPPGVDVVPVDALITSSRNVTPDDIWALSEIVRDQVAAGVDGVVVTHGTDTLEESAYGLALLLEPQVPIVLTGAMRGSHLAGADGPANVAAAVRVALEPALAQYGPTVVFADEIHVAGLVTKTHSSRLTAFTSPAAGPIGHISEGRVELLLGPPPHSPQLSRTAAPAARVEIIASAVGTDERLLRSAAEHSDGVVISGLGGGHLPADLAQAAVELAAQKYPLVLASRCADPDILSCTYSGVGSERHLLEGGLVPAGYLPPHKARLRLLFGLSADLDAATLFPYQRPSH